MRIISGQFKSRRINAPKHLPVRPTTDRAKEALFNILYHSYDLKALQVLDLFAGIGSISFEFASRGTTDITAVDQNKGCTDFINQTAESLDISINIKTQEVFHFLETSDETYDIIFADPPYAFAEEEFLKIIDTVFKSNKLKEKGILIVEHSKHTDLSNHPNFNQKRQYGHSVFSWFRKSEIA
ncbi:16S rRNA (guanine(966)-N(2))-methyltransferase RsmD [Flavobacteriaceae bacterium 14752]|uniref:16S rRNA (guanine(966)-N(2))-methyltransferase RsmD n=1 Tax=Mesohalobacter salilacus TaxID=2491711 RepID=UPI000F630F12|nr:16S rRNA (guanine(966)-N(2))-methyltransferase RsmD [Flavobacteriaceae bacterium 14752]